MTAATKGQLSHDIGADGIVSIRVRAGDIRIRAVEGETLRVRDVDGRDLESHFGIELGEGSASLLDGAGLRDDPSSNRGSTADLEVELPPRTTLVVETVSAEIRGDGLLGEQRYQTTSGDVTLRGASGSIVVEAISADLDIRATAESQVTARTVSGDVELRAGTLRALEVSTTSGDVAIAGRLAGTGPFAIETVSGDARLAPAGDVRIEMATMSGDLHSELEGHIEGARGHRTLSIGATGPLVTFRSMSGDLNVVRPVAVAARAPLLRPSGPEAKPTKEDDRGDTHEAMPPRNGAIAAAYEDARLGVLRALERGEIDVAEAERRFAALDGGEPIPEAQTGEPDPADETTRVQIMEFDDD
ncbi:MAG: DUF4097 family beta strand repeat-containing protein [Chloroflexota bacterium]